MNSDTSIEERLNAPMPWIGLYIAAASFVCLFAMAADVFNGFLTKKLWVPCKYFSLNAFSLTVLAIAMKLTLDLTTVMNGVYDRLANVSSLVMISIAMSNFASSLATIDNDDIFLNLISLAILVITIATNVCVRKAQINFFLEARDALPEQIAPIVLMLVLLVLICFYAMVIPTIKRYSESKYFESREENSSSGGNVSSIEMRIMVKKYWVLVETGSPQFVMARSVISVPLGLMCVLLVVNLISAYVRMPLYYDPYKVQNDSNYKWSTTWILIIQSGGVAIGIVAPLLRWFVVVRLASANATTSSSSSSSISTSLKEKLKVEAYWTRMLVEWRERPLPLRIRHYKCRKFLHDVKRLLLNVCIVIQIIIVRTSKLLLLFSAICAAVVLSCVRHIKKLEPRRDITSPSDGMGELGDSEVNLLRRFVILLEGEAELPEKFLSNICNEVDELIKKGTRQQPKKLIEFISKSRNFNGVREFDSGEKVRSLCSNREPPNCWSMPIVTLTSIAIAISSNQKASRQLVSNVSEGLAFVNLIEKTLDENGELASIRNAADTTWVGVELYQKWQDKELQKTNGSRRTYKETLLELSNTAEETVADFFKSNSTNSIDSFSFEKPRKWPTKVLASNSMYRVTQTLLQANEDGNLQSRNEAEIFDRLSVMISDIIAACLTNLPQVVINKCTRRDGFKERSKKAREAAVLVGESEEILQIVQKLELPMTLNLEKAAYVEEWRVVMEKERVVIEVDEA